MCPWFIAVSHATAGAFLKDSVGKDFLPKLFSGQESHGAPPGYYLLLAIFTFWPASLFAAPSLVDGWRRRREGLFGFLVFWIVPFWILLEIVPTKLPHYILPAYPALALLVADSATRLGGQGAGGRLERALAKWTRYIWLAVTFVLALAMLLLPPLLDGRVDWLALWPFGLLVVLAIMVQGWGRSRPWTWSLRLGVAAAVLVFPVVFQCLLPRLQALWISRQVVETLAAHTDPNRQPPGLVAVGYQEPSLVFLAGTGTVLAAPEGAAAHLLKRPGDVALVRRDYMQPFLDALADKGARAQRFAVVRGWNYSKGKSLELGFYRLAPELAPVSP